MNTAQNIKVLVFVNGNKVEIDEDGFFGELANTDLLSFQVEVMPNDANVIEFFKICTDSQNQREAYAIKGKTLPSGNKAFFSEVKILQSTQGIFYPSKENAIINILFCDNEKFLICEVALISQKGKFFLTLQKTYKGKCYDFEGCAFSPLLMSKGHERFDLLQLITLNAYSNELEFEKIDEEKALELLEKEIEKSKSILNVSDLEQGEARVLFWSHSNLWGIAAIHKSLSFKQVARIHWSQLEPRTKNGLCFLNSGEIVKFEATRQAHQGIFSTSLDTELLFVYKK